tara:strand:+ start:140 stop:529 length:390 start_codon:yes stop_codon:yes gene_type:complete
MSEQQQTLTVQQAIDLALQHHNAGRLSRTETIYQQILQSYPNQVDALHRHCQTKSNQFPKFLTARLLGCQLPPLGQCRGAVLLEDFAAVEMAFQIEVVVDRGVDGDELLQSLHLPEFGHRSLSSPEWLV